MPILLQSRPLGSSVRPTKREDEYAICGKCGCSWFEEVKLARIDKNQVVIPSQAVPKLSELYLILKCGKCNELHEPPMVSSTSPSYKQYLTMIQELDSPVKTEENPVEKK